MRKIWLVLSIMLVVMTLPAWADVAINETNFPDDTFRALVKTRYDENSDDKLNDEEIANIGTTIIVAEEGIYSLKGIEYLAPTSGTSKRIQCATNHLLALDLSNTNFYPQADAMNGQTRTLEKVEVSEGEEYPYSIKLKDYDGQFDLSKVTISSFMDYYGDKVEASEYYYLDTSMGAIKFSVKPKSLTYTYDTGAKSNSIMGDITVTFSDETKPPEVQISAENFPDANFRAYINEKINIYPENNHDNVLDELEIKTTEIDVSSRKIASLDGIELFTELTKLNCSSNDLKEIDISSNDKLTVLNLGDNALTAIDLSANTALTNLDVSGNQLQALDVSANTELTNLNCAENSLKTLDVSHNMKLTDINCSSNQLEVLDVSKNTALKYLTCRYNHLMALELRDNSAILPQAQAFDTQTVSFKVYHTAGAKYPYRINLNEYTSSIGRASDFMDRVTDFFSSAYTSGGVIYLSSMPSTTKYKYDTKAPNAQNHSMEGITATFTQKTDNASVSFSRTSLNVTPGSTVNIALSVSSNVGAVTWDFTSNPLNLSINKSTGAVSGTVPADTKT